MDRIVLSTLLIITAILLCQPIQSGAVTPPEFEPAFADLGTGEWSMPDELIDSEIVVVSQEPPTILLLAVGLVVVSGIGWKSKKAHRSKSPRSKSPPENSVEARKET